MLAGAYAQLGLFEVKLEPVKRETKPTLYVRFEDGYIVMYRDKECADYFSEIEDGPTARRIFEKDEVFYTFSDGTRTTYSVRWVKR